MKRVQKERLDLAKDILVSLVALGGVMMVAVAAPNALQLLNPLFKRYQKRTLKPSYIRQKFLDLEEKGLIRLSEKGDKTRIALTERGREKILEFQVDQMEVDIPLRWDGKWRLVIFDIPEKKKHEREIFRQKLKELEFEMIQDSVWRHKYPCHKEIEFLAHLYGIYPHVDLIEGKILKL